LGNRTIDKAQAWVEYCNGTDNPNWANLRRKHAREEPYKVKYWGLGNEMYGNWQIGALDAVDYSKKAREFAKVMKWTDPGIKLVSCGMTGWDDWDRIVLEALAPFVDFHSIHIYTGSNEYYNNVFLPHQAERALKSCQAVIDRVRYQQDIKHPIYVAYDEWNIWFREAPELGVLEERYTLADALAVATYLNIFIRHCRTVRMANLAQMVNVLSPIFTSKDGLFLQTIYFPLLLYAKYMQGIALDVYVESERYELLREEIPAWHHHRILDLGPFQLLDAAGTYYEAENVLALAVVNRDQEHVHTSTVQLTDAGSLVGAEVYEVNGASPSVINSFEEPEAVSVCQQTLEVNGQSFTYTFPAHSLTLLRLRLV